MDLEQFLREMYEGQRELTVPHKVDAVLRVDGTALTVRIKPANQEGAEFKDFVVKGNTVEPR